MKILMSLMTAAIMFVATGAYAASYSGNGQTRGFTGKTGFVKERTNEENHLGKDSPSADDDSDAPDDNDKAEERTRMDND